MKTAIDLADEKIRAALLDPGDTDWVQDLPEYVSLPLTPSDVVAVMVPTGALGLPPEEHTDRP